MNRVPVLRQRLKLAAQSCLSSIKHSSIQRAAVQWLLEIAVRFRGVSHACWTTINTPWSIQRIARRDETEWRAFNQYRKNLRLLRLERDLLFAGEHPIRFSLSLFVLAFVGYLLGLALPTTTFVTSWVNWKDAENLTRFSTLWAVQATLAALVYPIVIAFVTVYLQKRPAADAVLHLYVLDSGAFAAGLSSLTLVVTMAAQYVLLPFVGTGQLRAWTAFDAAWFLLNAFLTAYFLFKTIDFLRADVQSRVIRRYAVSVALPRDIYRLNLFQVLAQAHSKGWIPGPSYIDENAPDGPRVFLSRLALGSGEPQGMFRIREPSRLINVRLWLLRIAVGLWLIRAQRWPRPSRSRAFRADRWPLLTVGITPGTEYQEASPVARVDGGPPLTQWERVLIRGACVFRPVRRERYEIRVKTILGELAADAREAAGGARVEAFERAYDTIVDLHTLLLGASLARGNDGQIGSWAVLPDILSGFERPVYEGWVETYRSIFLAAISAMEVNIRPIRRLCNLALRLNGEELSSSPVEISENVLQLPPLMMYQLGEWWVRKIEEQGSTDHGPHRMAVLVAPQSRAYEEVVSTFIGSWENARTLIAEIPDISGGFTWGSTQRVVKLNWAHLQHTAHMLLAAVLRGDRVAAEWLADVLNKWWSRTDTDHQGFAIFGKSDFVTIEHVKLDWERVASILGITEEDLRWSGGRVEAVQREVLIAALRNLWTDTRLIVVELLSQLVKEGGPSLDDSLALYIAAGLLNGRQWRSGGMVTDPLNTFSASQYLAAKVREYAGDGDSRGGYEAQLCRLVAGVKDAARPSMIGSRVYSFFGSDDLASLQEQQLVLLALLSTREWSVGESLRRQIGVWMEEKYENIEIVRHVVESWLRRLEQPEGLAPNLLDALLKLTGRSHDAAQGRQRAKTGIESLRDVVESARTEALSKEPIDQARLDQIARFASSKGFAAATGKFPIQLFARIGHVAEQLEDFVLLRQRVPKGELTRVAMDPRPGGEEQFWADTIALHVGALLLSDVVGNATPHDVAVPDSVTFWTVLKAEAARFVARKTHPILVLDNIARPEWVWHWTHGERESAHPRPDDLTVRRVNGRGDGYICDFNQIEVYVGPVQPGYSLLLAREAFVAAAFREFGPGRYVDVSCDARDDSKVMVDMKLRISRQVEAVDAHLVRLRYGSEPAETGKGASA
jgi:hypothetical protein